MLQLFLSFLGLIVGCGVIFLKFWFIPRVAFAGIYIKKNWEHITIPWEIKKIPSRRGDIQIIHVHNNQWNKTLFHAHGNACSITEIAEEYIAFAEKLKMNILLVEYPGYLDDYYWIHEDSVMNALHTGIGYLKAHLNENYSSKNIYLSGQSVGTGPIIELAGTDDYGGVILEAPYKSLATIVSGRYFDNPVMNWILSWADCFKSYEILDKVKSPVFIIYYMDDTVIPPQHSQYIYDNLLNCEKKHVIKTTGGHCRRRIISYPVDLNKFIHQI